MTTALAKLTYGELNEQLRERENAPVTIAASTIARRWYADSSIRVELYGHEIACLYETAIWLDDAGYPTATTARRLRALVPAGYGVYVRNGRTWVTRPGGSDLCVSGGLAILG